MLASTFHDQTLEISFTDALISTDMIGAMIGATGDSTGKTAGGVYMYTEEVNYNTGGTLALKKKASTFAPAHSTSTTQAPKYTGWYRKVGETEWNIGVITNGDDAGAMAPSGSASLSTGKYCCKYMIDTAQSGDTTFNLNAD